MVEFGLLCNNERAVFLLLMCKSALACAVRESHPIVVISRCGFDSRESSLVFEALRKSYSKICVFISASHRLIYIEIACCSSCKLIRN